MPSTFTTSLGLTLPATGELSGTWGSTVNDGVTSLLDAAVAGTTTITIGGSDYTLTTTQGAANEARRMFLIMTGSPGAARNVIVPAVSKLYFVHNNTSDGFSQTVKTAAGTGVAVPSGARMVLFCNGTNVFQAINSVGDFTYTGTLTGGTGVVNLGGQFYKDAAGLVGINTTSPTSPLTVFKSNTANNIPVTYAITETATADNVQMGWNAMFSDVTGGVFTISRARGTLAAPTNVVPGNNAGVIDWKVYQSGTTAGAAPYVRIAHIRGTVEDVPSSSTISGNLTFWTNFNSDGTTQKMILTAAGSLGINTSNPPYLLYANGTFGFSPGNSVTPSNNGDVVIEATNNTTLTFKLRGSDGTVRSGTLTLS